MNAENEQTLVKKLAFLIAMTAQTTSQVEGGIGTLNKALSALERALREANSVGGGECSALEPSRYEVLNNLLSQAADACVVVNASVARTHLEMDLVISLTDAHAAQSTEVAQLRQDASQTQGVLSSLDEALNFAVSAISKAALQLQHLLRHRPEERSSWYHTQSLVDRLMSLRAEQQPTSIATPDALKD